MKGQQENRHIAGLDADCEKEAADLADGGACVDTP
jgi:hypothetical protein